MRRGRDAAGLSRYLYHWGLLCQGDSCRHLSVMAQLVKEVEHNIKPIHDQ
jgi:hypothetical protein